MDTVMVNVSGQELLLGHAVLLNAVVLFYAWRFAKKWAGGDAFRITADAILIWLVVQYLSVTLPGLCGVLNRWTMSAVALLLSAAMGWFGEMFTVQKRGAMPTSAWACSKQCSSREVSWAAWACALFIIGFVAAVLVNQRDMPVMSDDALTYHLPAAIRWLNTGRLGLREVWFFNPANTYSPLAGSTFIAWWYAPLGNDYLARFAQVPALGLIFFAIVGLCRALGASTTVAAAVALAAVLSRPFISQIMLAKDDLYLAGFFLMAVGGMQQTLLRDRLGPWRIGVALGMFLATKYTAMLALPILFLMIDAPFRAGWKWRDWAIFAGMMLLLAGPWFARNALLTGNPLYPIDVSVGGIHIFTGMFQSQRSLELRSAAGVWRVLTGGYFSIPIAALAMLVFGWACAWAITWRRFLGDPLVRVCLIGPIVGALIYVFASPFSEVRFLYPAFLLLFACCVISARGRGVWFAAWACGAIALAGACIAGSFASPLVPVFVVWGVVVAAGGMATIVLQNRVLHLGLKGGIASLLAALLVVAMATYLYQDANITIYSKVSGKAWESRYGSLGESWSFVRDTLPPGKKLAYANTYFVYPLMGFDGGRDVEYAPTRNDLTHLHDLPHLNQPVPGEQLRQAVAEMTMRQPDRTAWLANLQRIGAEYLFIAKKGEAGEAPELAFAVAEPQRFIAVFQNDAAVIYEIRRRQGP